MILTRPNIDGQVRCPSITTYSTAISLGVLVLVLIAWMLSSTIFNAIVPSLVSMNVRAAVTLILTGAALVTTLNIMIMWWTGTLLRRVGSQRYIAERAHDLYRHMFVHSNDCIAVMDPCGYYVEQNSQHEQLLGYTFQELTGQTPALTLGAKDFAQMWNELTRTGMYRNEALCRTKSGQRVCVDLSAFSIKDT